MLGDARRKASVSDRPTIAASMPFPRRGLNREQAAFYVGVSASKFDELVKDGRMPRPKRIDSRRIWDVRALDLAFDGLQDDPATKGDAWSDF
jgi:predicted DNA-binding transcriptional regulator AlpA